MRRVAPDVERLMWLIAEERDPKAIADFEARFPDLKIELAKHIAMVSGLKSAARKLPPHEIPRFVPRHVQPAPVLNRMVYVVAVFVLGAVAFGTYAVTSLVTAKPVTKLGTSNPQPEGSVLSPPSSDPLLQKVVPPSQSTPSGPATAVDPTPQAGDPLDKPISLDVEHAPLEAALLMVARSAGLTIQIGPGLGQKEVALVYQGMSARQVLDDLGRKHGFTCLPQERGNILVIPVRPDGDLNANASESDASGKPRTEKARDEKSPGGGAQ